MPPKKKQKVVQKAQKIRTLGNFRYKFPGKWDNNVQKRENNRHCLKIGDFGSVGKDKPMPPVHPEFDGMVPDEEYPDHPQNGFSTEKECRETTFVGWLSRVLDDPINKEIIKGEYVFNARQRNKARGDTQLSKDVQTISPDLQKCYGNGKQLTWASQSLLCAMESFVHAHMKEYVSDKYKSFKDAGHSRKNFNTFLTHTLTSEAVDIGDMKDLDTMKIYARVFSATLNQLQHLFFFKESLTSAGMNANKLFVDGLRNVLNVDGFKEAYNEAAEKVGPQEMDVAQMKRNVWNKMFDYIGDFDDRMKKDKSKKQAAAVTAPTPLSEAMLWKFVNRLCELVFQQEKWDRVKFDEKDLTRMGAAITLLQLCIGSRNLGILAVNEIYTMDNPAGMDIMDADEGDEGDEQEEEGGGVEKQQQEIIASSRNLLLVRKLTKVKKRDTQIANELKKQKEGGKSREEVEKMVDAYIENKQVVRPFQFYFLDPMNYSWAGKDKWSTDDFEKWDMRRVFLNLLRVVRRNIFNSKPEETSSWRTYNTNVGDEVFQIRVLKTRDFTIGKWYGASNSILETLTSGVQGPALLPSKRDSEKNWRTHDMRRLYVCYSYLMFAASYMKEIAYARKVLAHDSFDVSLYYTNIHIDQTLKSRGDRTGMTSLDITKSVEAAVKKELLEIRDVLDNLKSVDVSAAQEGIEDVLEKGVPVNSVTFVKLDEEDEEVVIVPMLRSLRGMKVSREMRVERAKKKIQYLVDQKLLVTVRQLQKLGISTDIMKDVWPPR